MSSGRAAEGDVGTPNSLRASSLVMKWGGRGDIP
jgi:hypothetical protein